MSGEHPSGADPVDRPGRVVELRDDSEIAAAIDLGTNSFHLLVARVDADGRFDVLAKEKEMVRLGSGSGDMAHLQPEAMERGIQCLRRFRQVADTYDATIAAVATSALREASNRDDFVTRARDEAGIDIEVVSGVEEARLIHLGVLQSVPVFDQRILVVDIGGGSTEFLVGQGADVLVARSTKLGAIRLTDRFFPEGRVKRKAVAECRTFIQSFLVPTFAAVRPHLPVVAVGSSGTINTIGHMAVANRGGDPSAPLNGESFTRDELVAVVASVVDAKDPEDRADLDGLDERRRDIIVAGAVLLEEIFAGCGLEAMTVSEAALREGILIDRAADPVPDAFHHLSDIRRQSVLRMADLFHEDLEHIHTATDLALALFDGAAHLHGLGLTERDYLEAAGLLHNIGLFISHAAHHKHSYYVIRHSDQLAGFTDHEIEIIALVARYHRKSEPKPSHDEFQALSHEDQQVVRTLAGMLRVGIALDRTRQQGVDQLTVRTPDAEDAVVVDVAVTAGCDLSLERYSVHQRLGLLESALGRPCRVEFTEDAS